MNGLRHGEGSFTFSDGKIYEGQWSKGQMCGKGKLYLANKTWVVYDGNWQDNNF